MPVEHVIIKKGLKRAELEEYLERELGRAGYGSAEIGRIPGGTRVALYVERPGMVIGKKGRSIKDLTDELAKRFGLENPQIEVVEIEKPELNAQIMARRIAFALERGVKVRRVGYTFLRRIMNAGARGAEIVIKGRIAGERSRAERFFQGYLSKAGEPAAKLVSQGYAYANLKPGVAGIKVLIMPPGPTPDEIRRSEAETGERAPEGPSEVGASPKGEGSGNPQAG